MSEPLDLADDIRVTRGILRTLAIKVYDPSDDSHADDVECKGFRGEKRVGSVAVDGGGYVTQTLADWTLIDLPERPVNRSIIVDPETGEQWVIDQAREHEANTGIWDVESHLLPTDA